ncbi:MAG TPA: ABC transporter permease [Thermoanaerobaculia bacterium]
MDTLRQDLRYALRTLAASPAFTAAAVLTLALGIGANTAVFSVVDAVLLDPLDLPGEDRLFTVWEDLSARGGPETEWTGRAVFDAWRDGAEGFEGLTAVTGWAPALSGGDRPEVLDGALVSHEYFRVLGTEPVLGRGFLAEEETPGKDRVLVLSHGLWERRFGADPAVVGSEVTVNGAAYTVVGIAPEWLRPPIVQDAELWSPLDFEPVEGDWGNYYLRVIGRLAPAVGAAAANAELEGIMARLGAEHPADLRDAGITLEPLRRTVVDDARTPLLALLGAVVLVLLVACTNVANLVLARAFGRDRELAVRTALGAGRRRLVGQLVTESLLLAAVGGAVGLAFGWVGMELLRSFAPAATPRLDEVALDGTVFAFTAAATALTGLLFGLVPAFLASRTPVTVALHEGGRGGSSAGRARVRAGLVVAELALGLALLVGAGLLIRTLGALHGVDPGFRAEGVVAGRLIFPSAVYPEAERAAAFVAETVARLEAEPGVEAAGAVSVLPLSGGQTDVSYGVEGRIPPEGEEPAADYRVATPGYFDALGIPLARGRLFRPGDDAQAPLVAVVSEELARRAFPGEDPVGRRIKVGGVRNAETPWRTVVGVVGGVRDNALAREPDPEIYLPLAQQPTRAMQVVARTATGGEGAAETLRRVVHGIDRAQPVSQVALLADRVHDSLAPQRFVTGLLAAFAGLALVLAAVGLYGVMAYAVGRRTREIGVRTALGARRGDVLALVLRQGAGLIVLGLALGALLAWGLARALAGLLYGVAPGDPVTFAGMAALLAVAALAATWLPARRAARLDPTEALRAE